MSRSIARSHDHLAENRRRIVAYAAAAAVAGLMPVPYLDDWLPVVLRRAMIRRIAEARQIDLDDAALRALADERVPEAGLRNLLSVGAIARTARRSIRGVILTVHLYRHAESASRTFTLGTLFDHYCTRLHVGAGIDAARARVLRSRFDAVVESRASSFGRYLFRRGFRAALQTSARAPVEVFHALTRGRLRRRSATPVEEQAWNGMTNEGRWFATRAVRAVDRQLTALGGGWIEGLLDAFDQTRA